MENELFSFQLFTPGSDIAIGFRPTQIIFARLGNDVVLGYQPDTPSNETNTNILVGDLPVEDPLGRQWNDTFILGDWNQPYYTDPGSGNFGVNSFAFIADFNPNLDTIQLHGSASNYQLLDLGFGTAITYNGQTGPDLVGFLFSNSDLNLGADYFEFRGITPPPGPVVPQAQQFGTSNFDIPLGIASDSSGNVYVAGGTNGSLAGANQGLRDNFFTKYNSQGNELFTQQFGTAGFDTIYGIDTDNQGNFYVTGITEGVLEGEKQADIFDSFVAKYDSNGNQLWIQQVGQNSIFNAFNIAVDKNTGEVYISGADVKNSLENPDDSFIIKFDTNGDEQWRQEIGTSGFLNFDENYGLTVGSDGDVYITGWTNGDLAAPNQGVYDNWLARLNNDTGAVQWIEQYGTPDYEWSWDVRTDSQGNVYTTGWTLGDLAGTGNAGSYDYYLTKFDNQGNQQWIKQFGSAGDDEAYNLFIDQNDNLFVSGYTNGNLEGTNAGSFDAWVARFDTEGNQQWINQFGTPDRDETYGLTGDNFGNLFLTGVTQGSLGGINAGSFDGWVAKIDAESGNLLDFTGDSQPVNALSSLSFLASDQGSTQTASLLESGPNTPHPDQVADFIKNYLGEFIQDAKEQIFKEGSNNPYLGLSKELIAAIYGTVPVSGDTIYGTPGNDTLYGGNDNDALYGKAGDDILYAGEGNNLIYGGKGNDRLYGGAGNDTVNGGEGNNLVYAGEGKNTVITGAGNDEIYTGASDDIINAGGGNNLIYAGEGKNTINTGAGNDTIYTGAGDDFIYAGAGDDLIYAGEGNNIIYGGTGNNTIYSGSGRDLFVLTPGEGSSTIVNFNVGKDVLGLTEGLTYEQLSIVQGTNGNQFFTEISIASTNDVLATLSWVNADSITNSSFAFV